MPQEKYEITDPKTGQIWDIETEGSLSEADMGNILRGIQERPSPRVNAVTYTGMGRALTAKARGPAPTGQSPQPRRPGVAWRDPKTADILSKAGDSQEDLGNAALAGMGAGMDAMNPEAKHWGNSLARQAIMPALAGIELADIGQQAFGNLRDGAPLMSLDPSSPGQRLGALAMGAVPLMNEGRAAFLGTEKYPQGGLLAAGDALKEDWESDPAGTIINLIAAGKAATHPAFKTLNEGAKALQTSGDLSAPGRQGALLSVNNPKRVVPALKDMVQSAKSQAGMEAVAARAGRSFEATARRPIPSSAPTAPMPPSGQVVAQSGPVPGGGVPLAPAPSRTPRAASPVSRSAMTEVKPGVYRMPSEVLDEALQTPTEARGALKRATAPDMLPAVQGPESVSITNKPFEGKLADGTSRVKPSPLSSSPEVFGLAVKPGNSEQFRGAWAKKIPLLGPMVAASERGFDGFLVSMRRGAFDDAAANLAKKGITPESSPQTYKDLATWINRASGVGSTPIPPVIADAMFAPRLTASRLELLNPASYAKLSPEVRKLAIKQVLTATGAGLSVLALAKASGADVSLDPESSDFGKVLLADGKTRYEVFAGMTPYARLAALALTGSPKTGKQAGKRLESMLGPLPSLALGAFRGSTFTGEDFDPLSETGKRFTPLVAQDMADAIKALGGVEGILKASPALGGVGIQVYDKKKADVKKGGK